MSHIKNAVLMMFVVVSLVSFGHAKDRGANYNMTVEQDGVVQPDPNPKLIDGTLYNRSYVTNYLVYQDGVSPTKIHLTVQCRLRHNAEKCMALTAGNSYPAVYDKHDEVTLTGQFGGNLGKYESFKSKAVNVRLEK